MSETGRDAPVLKCGQAICVVYERFHGRNTRKVFTDEVEKTGVKYATLKKGDRVLLRPALSSGVWRWRIANKDDTTFGYVYETEAIYLESARASELYQRLRQLLPFEMPAGVTADDVRAAAKSLNIIIEKAGEQGGG